jgi:hypothetical protein
MITMTSRHIVEMYVEQEFQSVETTNDVRRCLSIEVRITSIKVETYQ